MVDRYGAVQKEEFGKIDDKKVKEEMVNDFINFYGNNILNESTLINGVENFLKWCNKKEISLAVCTNKTRTPSCRFIKENRYL